MEVVIFELLPKFHNTEGVDPKRRVSIPSKCVIKTKDGTPVRIAYDPTRPSIRYDEWSGYKPDWAELNPPKINWTSLTKVLGDRDPLLKEYLRICSWNSDTEGLNGHIKVQSKFKEIKRESLLQESEEDTKLRLRAEMAALDMDESTLISLASVIDGEDLGVNTRANFKDTEGNMHSGKFLRGIMRQFASENPEVFFKYYEDDNLEIMDTMREAVERGIIKVNAKGRNIVYCSSGESIPKSKAPNGINPLDYFASRVSTNKDFEEHYQNIVDILNGDAHEEMSSTPNEVFEQAKASGIIEWKSRSYFIGNTDLNVKNKGELQDLIKSNAEVDIDGETVLISDYLVSRIRE